MSEKAYVCEIPHAEAMERDDCSRDVKLYIPRNPIIPEKYDFVQGKDYAHSVIQQLKQNKNKYIPIANEQNPLRPPSGGLLDILVDSKGKIAHIVTIKKDAASPRTPGYHVHSAGFPTQESDWASFAHAPREAAEEILYLTRDGEALLPKEFQDSTKDEMKKLEGRALELGLKLSFGRNSELPARVKGGKDGITVYKGGELRSSVSGVFCLYPNIDFAMYREIELSPEDIIVHDLEGYWRDCVIFKVEDVKNKRFGEKVPALIMTYPREGNEILSCNREIIKKEVEYKPCSTVRQALYQLGIYPDDLTDEKADVFLKD
jgi:hypothetical protein